MNSMAYLAELFTSDYHCKILRSPFGCQYRDSLLERRDPTTRMSTQENPAEAGLKASTARFPLLPRLASKPCVAVASFVIAQIHQAILEPL